MAKRMERREAAANIDSRWFKERIDEKFGRGGVTRLAELMNMGEFGKSKISLMINGKRRMTIPEAGSIATILGVPTIEVLKRAGLSEEGGVDRVPIVARIDADGRLHPRRSGRASPPGKLPAESLAARCEDTTSLMYGWTIFYEPRASVPPEAVGRLCVIETPDGSKLLRIVRHGFDTGSYHLASIVGGQSENAKIVSASPVLWIQT